MNTISFIGAPGQGKTSCMRAQLAQRDVRQYIALDPWQGEKDSIPADVWVDSPSGIAQYLDLLGPDDDYRISINCPISREPQFADEIARIAMRRRDCTLLIDEAQYACGLHTASLSVLDVARRGRHRGVELWLGTQRPSDVNRSMTSSGERYVFWLQEAVDLKYIRSTLGKGAERIVRDLEPLHYLHVKGREVALGRIIFLRGNPRAQDLTQLNYADLY